MSPTIIRTGNLQIRVYPKDHNPPHVHVIGPDAEAKIRLHDLQCYYSKGFSKRALKQIKSYLKQNKKLLLEAWDDYQA
jgi:hypothetical protein